MAQPDVQVQSLPSSLESPFTTTQNGEMHLPNARLDRPVITTFINGKSLPINETRLRPVYSNASGKEIHSYQSADISTCDQACDAAWTAYKTWKNASVATRRQLLSKFCGMIEERKLEIMAAVKLETSSGEFMASMNIGTSIEMVQSFSAAISEIRGLMPPHDEPGKTTFVFKESIGPILIIAPWNGAFLLAVRAVIAAIAAGCPVVLKASEVCPMTHRLLVEMLHLAGCPPGVVNFVCAHRDDAATITEALIGNKHIRKIDFIGSANVGRAIATTAAKYMKPVLMELGGKNPTIVLDDANLDRAAVLAAMSATFHEGQVCVSTDRIIVQRSVSQTFIEKLVAQFKNVQGGHAATATVANHAQDLLKDAKQQGVKFLFGDADSKSSCALLQIDAAADPASVRIIDEETFGPSAVVYVVDNDEEAVQLANRTEYGLTAAVHTSDMARGLKIGRQLECGQVVLNGMTFEHNMHAPFSGTKGSGYGKTLGVWHLENFYVDRTITWSE